MQAKQGDRLIVQGRIVGEPARTMKIIEVLGRRGEPPYRVRLADGHEAIVSPGPDAAVQAPQDAEK